VARGIDYDNGMHENGTTDSIVDLLDTLVRIPSRGATDPYDPTLLAGNALPEPERHLLVHASAMTPRLRAFHGSEIDLTVLTHARAGAEVARAALLLRRSDHRPAALGAIRIRLDALPESVRATVLEGRVPFGAILEHHAIAHTSHPLGFFQIEADAALAGLLGAATGQCLYGRSNELRRPDGELLAAVVEVLPPRD
jgi:chorismate-pyruvate lyase